MIGRQDERLFRQAAVVATTGEPHVRVGVVLATGRRPYVWESNRSGPEAGIPFHDGHAEVRALKKVRPKSTLYVARLDRSGTLMPSRPCKVCTEAIRKEGSVRKVVYFDGHEIRKVRV